MARQLTPARTSETAADCGGGASFAGGGAAWAWRDILAGTAIFLVGAALSLAAALAAGAVGLSPALAVSLAALVGGCAMLVAARRRLSWDALGWRLPARGRHWLLAPAALVTSIAFTAIYALAADALGASFLIPETLPAEFMGAGWTALAVGFAVVIWTPLAEETFFRGFLFAGLAAKMGVAGGISVSSALFAAAHGSAGAFIPALAAGALFAWTCRESGSLLPAALAHASQNLLAFASAFFAP